ncbi:MAG: SDR family oxidoreductase [Victivallales bacterium]|nr:SDR family oxidoreductase [Victivallales bacterium]
MELRLTGQLLVIGGARGIGAEVVRVASASGAKVAWTCTGGPAGCAASESLVREIPGATWRAIDCCDESALRSYLTELPPIDYLVYNAGFTSPCPFAELNLAEWRRTVDINLTGAFVALRAVLPGMKERGRGAIVLVGSAAVVSGGGGRADYVAAKAGLEALSKAVTREYAPYGIRCNVVHPSLCDTDLLRQRHPDPEHRAKLAAQVPLRRLGTPRDNGEAVLFFLSDAASYLTAQAILVDGGRSYCK